MKLGKLVGIGAATGCLLWAGAQTATAGPVIYLPNDQGWLQLNYEMQLYGQWRDTGSGRDGTEDTSEVYFRRNRFSLMGRLADDKYGFYYAIENQGDRRTQPLTVRDESSSDFHVLDAYFLANVHDNAQIRAGLIKDPLVRAHNVGCFFALTLDRSDFVYTALPRRSRDYGAMVWGNLLDQKLQYKVAATTGLKDNTPGNDLRYTIRGHYSLLDAEPAPLYFGTYFGNRRVLTIGGGYQYEREAVYGNQNLETNPHDFQAWTVDLFGELPTRAGTFNVEAAYLDVSFDDNYLGGAPDPVSMGIDGEKNGYYAQAGYLLPNNVGPGQMQFFGRYESWNFANLYGVVDQELDRLNLGINYFLRGQDLRLTLEWSDTDFEVENQNSSDFQTVTAMLQFLF